MRKMKKRSLLSLLMTAAMAFGLLSPVQAFADTDGSDDNMTELSLPNGDFETGDAENWVLSGYSEVKSDGNALNNTTNMLNLWLNDDEDMDGSASYSVVLTEGTYYFTFDLSGAEADSGLKYSVTAGDGVLAEGVETYKTTGRDVWETYATDSFTLTESAEVTFTLSGTQTAGYWGWLDNLKLYGTGSVSSSGSNPVDLEPANPEPTDLELVDSNPVDPEPANPYSLNSRKDYGVALGSDISAAADTDKTYTNKDGETKKLYDICTEDYGMNMVRLRTWVNHSKESCNEENIIAYAKKCDEAGLRVMVDFHYADNWADPGKQPPPSAWNVTDNISFEEAERVGDELYNYTYNFLTHMIDEGVTPEWVQVGNEITNGMIWPLCNIANYENFTYVLQKGIDAVRAASPDTKVVIHIDNGASTENVISWFERLVEAGVTDFDVMGLSFYPSDHDPTSSIESLANTFEGLYNEFCVGTDREIMVVEIGANYLSNATENQKYNMIVNVINELKAIPNGRGTGCAYWEIENYEMNTTRLDGGTRISKPNRVWEAFSPNAQLVNENPVTAISLAEGEALELEINDVHQLQVNVEPEQPDITRMAYTSANSLSGSCSLHFTGGSGDVDFTFYQDINGLAPGKYRLTGYVMGDTGVTTLNLFAQATDKEFTSELYKTIGWGGSSNFVKMTLDDIEVPDGKLRVGAHAAATYAGSESWGDFDDLTLELVEAYEVPEEPDSEARIALQNLYDLNKDLEQGSYTDSSYQAFKKALTAAADILANEDATDDELTAAYSLLSGTIGGLVEAEKPGQPGDPENTHSETRSALQNLYNASKNLAQGKYTNNSYAAFTKALKAAETVLSDEDAADAELTEAYNALKDAIAGLKTDASSAKPSSSTAVKTSDTAPVAMYALFVLIAFGIVLSALVARRRYRR